MPDLTGRISTSTLVAHPETESHFLANRSHLMLQAFVITLREGLEAFLIVAISLSFLRKSGRSALATAVHWGIAVAAAVSAIGGYLRRFPGSRMSSKISWPWPRPEAGSAAPVEAPHGKPRSGSGRPPARAFGLARPSA